MFIDKSYFTGPLTIAQLGQQDVIDNLNDVIARYEDVIMQATLGYDFYQTFLAGIEQGSDENIEQRWLNLLNGCAFVNASGIKKYFAGFAGGSNTNTLIAAQRNDLFIYGGQSGFPIGNNVYTDPSLKGWNFDLEIFGAGTLDPAIDYTVISSGGVRLTDPNYQVQQDEKWIFHFTGKKLAITNSGAANKRSPLAGFIYYEYMKDLATQVTGIGVVKSQGDNAIALSPVKKMCNMYNEAVDQIQLFWELMQADQLLPDAQKVYPEFDPNQVVGYFYGYYNRWQYWWNYRGAELYSFRFVNPFGI